MTQVTVSVGSMLCMAIAGLLSFCIPVVLCIFFRKRKHADLVPFFIGMAVMCLFALVLESLVHQLVLNGPIGETILNNIWLYALYGGLMAGLFEETGRFIAFLTVLKRYRSRDVNALMYGAGHGGFEAAALLGGTMISNLVLAFMINSGLTSVLTSTVPQASMAQLEAVFEALKTTQPVMFFISLIERVIAVPIQIALSVIVWFAAKEKGKRYLYPVAILLHFLVDAILTVAAKYISSLWIVYAILIAEAVSVILFALLVWKRNHREEPAEAPAEEHGYEDQTV